MKILLLGGAGMLGHALQETFTDSDLTVWDRPELDITNREQVKEKIAALKPEVIINAAAYTNVDQAEKDKDAAFAVNATGVQNVAQAAQDNNATLVHYSTDYIFPGDKVEGYTEDDKPGPPVNIYGESKLAGEQAIQKIGPKFYLIRTAWLYGAYGKNFVDTILELGRTRENLNVVNDQYGSPTNTKDLARATKELLEKYEPGIYHAVNEGATTWFNLAVQIFQLKGLKVNVDPVTTDKFPRPAKRPKYSILMNTRGPRLRNWQAALDEYLANH